MSFLGFDVATLALIALFLGLGGTVKGVLGIGLPLFSVPLLSLVMPVPEAIAVLAAPVILANIVQMRQGNEMSRVFARFWPLLLTLVIGIFAGTRFLAALSQAQLSLVLGIIVVTFALMNMAAVNFVVPHRHERLAGPFIGFGAGLVGGMSSFFGPPIVSYMVALQLNKDTFVSAIAMVYTVGAIPLYGSLVALDVIGGPQALLSALALIPVFLGIAIGQRVRRFIPQATFRHLLLGMLVLIGLNLTWRGLTG